VKQSNNNHQTKFIAKQEVSYQQTAADKQRKWVTLSDSLFVVAFVERYGLGALPQRIVFLLHRVQQIASLAQFQLQSLDYFTAAAAA
jgi:hypothetical protein